MKKETGSNWEPLTVIHTRGLFFDFDLTLQKKKKEKAQ